MTVQSSLCVVCRTGSTGLVLLQYEHRYYAPGPSRLHPNGSSPIGGGQQPPPSFICDVHHVADCHGVVSPQYLCMLCRSSVVRSVSFVPRAHCAICRPKESHLTEARCHGDLQSTLKRTISLVSPHRSVVRCDHARPRPSIELTNRQENPC